MQKAIMKDNTNKWFKEIIWLAGNFERFSVDEFRILCHANEIEMPRPAANLGNILRSAQKEGLIEPTDEFVKSKWSKSSRVPRRYWKKKKEKSVG